MRLIARGGEKKLKTVVEVEEWMLSLWLMDVGEAESLPLLNEEVSKSSNCGGMDSSARIGGFLRS